ncbi:hypothetical protein AB0K89_02260 [Streptomyces cinnamoneus]|uniref:hypothetical protein n=1 Tax=Streptomyces cinnamoneus TaxID=53446 RepID=UPI00343A3855
MFTHQRRHVQRPGVLFAALGALLIGTCPAATAAPAAAPAPVRSLAGTVLSCALRTPPGEPVTFRPAVTGQMRQVSAAGTALLDHCSSPDGSQTGIKSGRLVVRGTALASCFAADRLNGSGTITWYSAPGQHGRDLGTSQLRPGARRSGYTPADSFLSGIVTDGRMKGRHVQGSAVPTTDVTGCAERGVRSVAGRGRITIS